MVVLSIVFNHFISSKMMNNKQCVNSDKRSVSVYNKMINVVSNSMWKQTICVNKPTQNHNHQHKYQNSLILPFPTEWAF